MKNPLPDVFHSPEDAEPPIVPEVVKISLEQIVASDPAFTITPALIVTITSEEFDGHGPTGSSVVKVKVTAPALISSIEGV